MGLFGYVVYRNKEVKTMTKQQKTNKEWGFWGTIKQAAKTDEQITNLFNITLCRLRELYPDKGDDFFVEFLNSRAGRHFADYLLDNPGRFNFGVVAMKIAMLNKVSMKQWLTCYWLGAPGQVGTVNRPLLYRAALRSMMQFPDIYEKMRDMVGCNLEKPVWETPEQWIDSENVTAEELKTLWLEIQDKVA